MSSAVLPIDPEDPRAPSAEVWATLSSEARARVVASLPAEVPESLWMPEGDRHSQPKLTALDVLRRYFDKLGKRVYLSAELNVYYPGERRFCPDLIGVLDVEPGPRDKWVVSQEGRGLDFVLEVHASGDRDKDFVRNVAWFARLGIPEYFVFDAQRRGLVGYRLVGDDRRYTRIMAQGGRLLSEVLGVDLLVEDGLLAFAPRAGSVLLESSAMLVRFESLVDELNLSLEQERAAREAAVAEREAERAAREAAVAEREAERTAREAAVAEREAERTAREAAVAEREAERAAREAAESELRRLRAILEQKG
jgi:Uma2 family endonuclease